MAILKIVLVLGIILTLIRFKVPLSATLLGSSVAMGFLFHLSPARIASGSLHAAFDPDTLKLIGSLILIILFSSIIKETGNMGRAITAVRNVFRDARATVALIPATIGVLPVIGGAMLSAPMVAEASEELKLNAEQRTFLNFWFRHIWEYMLPTYPSLILAASIVGVPVGDICLINLPLTIAAISAGIFLGFRGVRAASAPGAPLTAPGIVRYMAAFGLNLLPFFIVLLLTLYWKLHLFYSLALVIAAVIVVHRLPLMLIGRLGRQSFSWELVFLIWGIMIFKELLDASGAMTTVSQEFARTALPSLVLIIGLPVLLAIITGYPNAFIGISVPLLLPMLKEGGNPLPYLMLVFASGECAHLLSPMHLCLVMTREYYRADMNKVYRMLIPPVSIIFLTGIAVFLISLWLAVK